MEEKKGKRGKYVGGGDELSSQSSSSTIHFEFNIYKKEFERVDTKPKKSMEFEDNVEYKRIAESFQVCKTVFNETLIEKLAFVLTDKAAFTMEERKNTLLREVTAASKNGFYMRTIKSLCIVLDYFTSNIHETTNNPLHFECYNALLRSIQKPVILIEASDAYVYKEDYFEYYNIIAWLLIGLELDERFRTVFNGLFNLLTLPDAKRDSDRLALRFCQEYSLDSGLVVTAARMIALSSSKRFKEWLLISTLLASVSPVACLKMMEENMIENIFYRFNPYYPEQEIPEWNNDPYDFKDDNLVLGDATKNMSKTLSLLLVLIKSTITWLENHKKEKIRFKVPDENALRMLFVIEFYMTDQYDLNLFYYNIRLLQTCLGAKNESEKRLIISDFLSLHGVSTMIRILEHITNAKEPWERQQVISARCISILLSTLDYPDIICHCCQDYRWPESSNKIALMILNKVFVRLKSGVHLSERLLIALANLIWECIIWDSQRRAIFIANQGVYKILDVLSMTKFRRVQCIILGLLSDLVLDSKALSQMLTWRKHRGTKGIVSLLTTIFKTDLLIHNVSIDKSTGLILDEEFPLLTAETRHDLHLLNSTIHEGHISESVTVSHMLGKRAPKIYSILHLIGDELKQSADLVEETYNLYSSIKLTGEEELMLILITHFLVCKVAEAWLEVDLGVQAANILLLEEDEMLLSGFRQMYRGWMREIKIAQLACMRHRAQKEKASEVSLYDVFSRVRLCSALDGLRELRCLARSSYYLNLHTELLSRAVSAHIKHTLVSTSLDINVPDDVVRTYTNNLDHRISKECGSSINMACKTAAVRLDSKSMKCGLLKNILSPSLKRGKS